MTPIQEKNVHRPDIVARKGITYLNLLLIFLSSLPAWIQPLQDALTPVGVSPSFWIYVPVAIAAVTIFARQGIAALQIIASGFSGGVSVGFSTILGYALTFLTGIPAALAALDQATKPLNIDPDVFVRSGAILTAVTTLGFALQAAAAGWNKWKTVDSTTAPGTGGYVPPSPPPVVPGTPVEPADNPTVPDPVPAEGGAGDVGGEFPPDEGDQGSAVGPDGKPL